MPYPAGGPTDTIAREEQTPAALAEKQQAELAKWTPLITEAGLKAE